MTFTLKICFIAPTIYSLLVGRNPKAVVGPDVHSFLLATELLNHGFQVGFITYGDGSEVECINGLEIIKIAERKSYLGKFCKAFYLWKAMKKAGAHIYIHSWSLGVSLICRLMNVRNVYEIASDALVQKEVIDPKNREFHRPRFSLAGLLHTLDIKLADVIIVQTEFQRRMLKQNYKKESIVVRMPFPYLHENSEKKELPVVLWVGSIADVKQPMLFLKLAKLIPKVKFQMIGGYTDTNRKLYEKIKQEAKRIPNLEFLGSVPFYRVNKYFKQASILVNTSRFEGFPNAFVQAWIYGVPVVSLNADPDEVICRYKLGFHSKTFSQLVKDAKTLLEKEDLRNQIGENCKHYAKKEHDIATIIKKYVIILKSLANMKKNNSALI